MRHGKALTPLRRAAVRILVGFGLVLATGLVLAEDLVIPDTQLGLRTAPLLLLTRPDVQADMRLSPEQSESARRLIADLRERARKLPRDGSPEVVAERKKIDSDQLRWLDSQLTEEQQTRLIQIDLQWEGQAALATRKAIADRLGLSVAQREKLKKAVETRNRRRDKEGDWVVIERDLTKDVRRVLTRDQVEHWEAMLGREFQVRTVATNDKAKPDPTPRKGSNLP